MIFTLEVLPATLSSESVAIELSAIVHLTVLKDAPAGVIPSLKVAVSPRTILKVPSVSVDVGVRAVICTVSFTVTLQVAFTDVPLLSVAVTVIVADEPSITESTEVET